MWELQKHAGPVSINQADATRVNPRLANTEHMSWSQTDKKRKLLSSSRKTAVLGHLSH